ncbi:acyltransferase family protein [Clostridium paridis]|uniref:Acyltransferase n=1 Tax=Clostridium paridis TaxID=2803863 RepID=A0A937FGM7_9CLOT|nr:acyltransferase [Clostridium paridis]MBL4932620.1 acyltransferase [Clostridium paridis]
MPKTSYEIYTLLFIVTTIFSFRKTDGGALEINPSLSNEIKGLGIFLVLAGHLSRNVGIHNMFVNQLGAQGVVLFLFISGFGLTKSYKKNGIDLNYIKKRFHTVLLPFSIVTSMWILINIFIKGKQYSVTFIFLSVLGIEPTKLIDTTMWYIEFIILWYIAFGIIFKFKIPKYIKLSLLFVVSIGFYLTKYNNPFDNMKYQFHVHAFIFPLGVFWGFYSKKIIDFLKSKKILNIIMSLQFLVCIILVLVTYNYLKNSDTAYIIYNLTVGMIFIMTLVFISYCGYKSNFLIKIGAISYFVYLFEGVFREEYSYFKYFNGKVSLTFYLLTVIVLSIIYDFIMKKVKLKK